MSIENLEDTIPSAADPNAVTPTGDDKQFATPEEATEYWKSLATNYKRENEGYRKDPKNNRSNDLPPADPTPTIPDNVPDETVSFLKNDYLSKREDAIFDFKKDIETLEESEWQKVKDMIAPALDGLYLSAVQKLKPVARGEINKTIQGIIEFAKGEKKKLQDIETARAKGAAEVSLADKAEISAARPSARPNGSNGASVRDEDKKVAEESGGVLTPERAAEMRLSKEARKNAYAPNDWGAQKG